MASALTQPVSVGIHVPSSAVAALDSGEMYAEFFRQVEALGLGVPSLDLTHLRRVAHEVAPALRARAVDSR